MPIIQKIAKASRELPIEFARYLRKQYPPFVTRNISQLPTDDVPVFMFHTVEQNTLESQLAFLKTNGYETLDSGDLYRFLKGELELKKPSVALTFDDGDVSWHRVALPLLEKYSYKAIGFIAPHYVSNRELKTEGKAWMSWTQIRELQESGYWDIQSHTYYHNHIFTEPELIDIFEPSEVTNPLGLDTPWVMHEDGSHSNQLAKGYPIYRYSSRFDSKPMFIPNKSLIEACLSQARQLETEMSNKEQFKKAVIRYHQQEKLHHSEGRYETQDEQHEQILTDLKQAKEMLENSLDHRVEHLCYPWGIGSDLSVNISREAGYLSNYWGSVKGRNQNKPGSSSYHICRLKDDYIFRLPGEGRRSLLQIFKAKAKRRTQTLDIY